MNNKPNNSKLTYALRRNWGRRISDQALAHLSELWGCDVAFAGDLVGADALLADLNARWQTGLDSRSGRHSGQLGADESRQDHSFFEDETSESTERAIAERLMGLAGLSTVSVLVTHEHLEYLGFCIVPLRNVLANWRRPLALEDSDYQVFDPESRCSIEVSRYCFMAPGNRFANAMSLFVWGSAWVAACRPRPARAVE